MKSIAIITARGGSKRIPKKNIKDFMGKPMIAYAIEAGLESNVFEEVMVSTDCSEIAEVAKKYGAQVPFMRSEKTSDDFATTFDVLDEVLTEYRKIGKEFDTICCIYPCVPFLSSKTLKNAHDKLISSNNDALFPVVKYSFPIQRAFIMNSKNLLKYREPENAIKRSQDLEETYHDCGMFYYFKADKFYESNSLVLQKTMGYVINEMEMQDIDTDEDWKTAEMKYKILKYA